MYEILTSIVTTESTSDEAMHLLGKLIIEEPGPDN